MRKPFKKGDRVRISLEYRDAWNLWSKLLGTVIKDERNEIVGVRWDGKKYQTHWHQGYLERVKAK